MRKFSLLVVLIAGFALVGCSDDERENAERVFSSVRVDLGFGIKDFNRGSRAIRNLNGTDAEFYFRSAGRSFLTASASAGALDFQVTEHVDDAHSIPVYVSSDLAEYAEALEDAATSMEYMAKALQETTYVDPTDDPDVQENYAEASDAIYDASASSANYALDVFDLPSVRTPELP